MTDDLVKRLRDLSYNQGHDLPDKAADRIEKLERENNDTALHLYAFASRIEKLEAALREIIGALNDPKGGQHVYDMRNASYIARKALEGKND